MQHRVSFGIVDPSSRIQFVPRYNGNQVSTGIHVTLPDRKKRKKNNNQDAPEGMDAAEYNEETSSPEQGFLVTDLPPEGITSEDGTVNIRPLEQEEWDNMRQIKAKAGAASEPPQDQQAIDTQDIPQTDETFVEVNS
ncbi:hypothetical protein NQZ79_g3107 [Umbelopsis isabellina]|nr:hypothetical protein NQZ79_g3107 [Umbelopsis isabellina]